METLKISQIVPDKNQPRKLFVAERLASLRKSVEKHGIMTPIIVEKMKDGKFLIVDGERRFRVASDLGLKEVPTIAISPQSPIDRIVQQFHIQEQHEGWTATEKATVISELARELDVDFGKACDMLGIQKRTAEKYIAFLKLADKAHFQENKLDLDWASKIANLKNTVRSIYNNVFEEEFLRSEEKKLEHAVIRRIKDGSLTKQGDISKLKDAFVTDTKTVKQFMESDVTAEGLFVKTKAKDAYHLRNLRNLCGYVSTHGNAFMESGTIKIDPATMNSARSAYKTLKAFVGRYSDITE